MKNEQSKFNRRNFLKTVGAASLGSVLVSTNIKAEPNVPAKPQETKLPQVPRRMLGKTGVEVPVLALGFGGSEDTVVLKKSLEWGVNYWDTSLVAAGGNSELGIGKFLLANPQTRKDIFIVSKESKSKNAEDREKCLQTSLGRMNTKYIDLYFGVYMMSEPAQLTDEVKKWAQSAKERKLIRFFGFSTHKNMAKCLAAAAKTDWIDAVMLACNFRLMQDAEMIAAIDACNKAGVGIVAMKTQGMGQKLETEADKKLISHFLQKGFTEGQAKIKAVLEDKRISSVCSGMSSVALLTSNVAAVLDRTALSQADMDVLAEYAAATCSGYCAGCADICTAALPDMPYTSDIMRYLMYYNSYGEREKARELFAQIPANVRSILPAIDCTIAEARCPQHLPIAKLLAEAADKLA